MILLFTACRSLKYPLSGNKTPCPFLYIGPIYRRGGKEKKKKKSSIKIKEEKKELLLQWSRKNQSLTRHPPNHIIYRQKPAIPWLRFKIQPLE